MDNVLIARDFSEGQVRNKDIIRNRMNKEVQAENKMYEVGRKRLALPGKYNMI